MGQKEPRPTPAVHIPYRSPISFRTVLLYRENVGSSFRVSEGTVVECRHGGRRYHFLQEIHGSATDAIDVDSGDVVHLVFGGPPIQPPRKKGGLA